jgi:hypothetical protein
MADRSTSGNKIVSIALIVIGVGLLIWGYQLSGSIGSQISQTVTGSDTDKVMTLYIGARQALSSVCFFI